MYERLSLSPTPCDMLSKLPFMAFSTFFTDEMTAVTITFCRGVLLNALMCKMGLLHLELSLLDRPSHNHLPVMIGKTENSLNLGKHHKLGYTSVPPNFAKLLCALSLTYIFPDKMFIITDRAWNSIYFYFQPISIH